MTEEVLSKGFQFIRNGLSIKQSDDAGGIPITRIETISDRFVDASKFGFANLNEENLGKRDDYFLIHGDILMSHINSPKHLGKSAIYEGEEKSVIHGMNLLCLRPKKDELLPKYAYYYFQSIKFLSEVQKISNQSVNQASFAVSKVKNLKIPLPTLSTQKKIASILDAADAHRQKTKQLLAKYDELAQSIFLEMFGDPVTNPMGWEVKRLEEVCCKITDGTHHSPEPTRDGAPYVTAKHVKPFKLDFSSKATFINWKDHEAIYKRCSPKKGDVLYIKDGATTGIACINTFDEEISLLSSLALIQTNRKLLNPEFLCFWLNYENMKALLLSIWMSGAAIQRYTLKKIKSFEIMIPPIELQEKFSLIINQNEEIKSVINREVNQSENLFNSLLQKAFKGELVNQNISNGNPQIQLTAAADRNLTCLDRNPS